MKAKLLFVLSYRLRNAMQAVFRDLNFYGLVFRNSKFSKNFFF